MPMQEKTTTYKKYTIDDNFANIRITRWLKKICDNAPFSLIAKLLRKKTIKVNGKKVNDAYILSAGDEVILPRSLFVSTDTSTSTSADSDIKSKGKPLNFSKEDIRNFASWIIYEDKNIIAVNKPYDVPTQAGTGIAKSLDRLVTSYFKDAKLLHRLDRHTSGLVLFA